MRPMSTRDDLLADIEAFLVRHDMAASTFGRLAVKSHKFVWRLRSGKDVTTSSADAARQFMTGYQGRKARPNEAAVSAA